MDVKTLRTRYAGIKNVLITDAEVENLAFLILCVCTIGALALMVYSIFFHELSPFVVYIMAVTGVVLACVWYLCFKTR